MKKTKYGGILVKDSIRREGIGTVLLDNCKKDYDKLSVEILGKNKIALMFFESNGFKIINKEINQEGEDAIFILEWKKQEKNKVKLVYFDNDIDSKFLNDGLNFDYQSVDMKKFFEEENIKNLEIYNIKTYINFRKKIEKILNSKKILLYIDYNNYYRYLDDQIKDLIRIKKIDLKVLVCEPFSIENTKKNSIIKEIEESYKNYEIIRIDCSLEYLKEDISLNQIFSKRNELLVQKIQAIAENM